jgi:hypothetical protein
MKNQLLSFLIPIIISTCSYGQVQLNGKFVLAKTRLNPVSELTGKLENESKFIYADSLGNFTLENLGFNKSYSFEIHSMDYGSFKFNFTTTNEKVLTKIFELIPNCEYNAETAKSDWTNKKPKLLLFGSLAPRLNSKADLKFEKKYNIEYYEFGCTPPPLECAAEYNKTISEFLDNEFGVEWRKYVRKDIL